MTESERNPPYPPQFETRAAFGRLGMRWGSGEDAAIVRMAELTRDELFEIGVTLQMAMLWQNFYEDVVRRNPANGSARGRVVLMRRAVELLRGQA
jgi:hypothetical protein